MIWKLVVGPERCKTATHNSLYCIINHSFLGIIRGVKGVLINIATSNTVLSPSACFYSHGLHLGYTLHLAYQVSLISFADNIPDSSL